MIQFVLEVESCFRWVLQIVCLYFDWLVLISHSDLWTYFPSLPAAGQTMLVSFSTFHWAKNYQKSVINTCALVQPISQFEIPCLSILLWVYIALSFWLYKSQTTLKLQSAKSNITLLLGRFLPFQLLLKAYQLLCSRNPTISRNNKC